MKNSVLFLFLLLIGAHTAQSQKNLLSIRVLLGDGTPANALPINIHNSQDSLIACVLTDKQGNVDFHSDELIVSLDIRSNDLKYKSAYDRCYLLQNDTTQKIYVLYPRNKEELGQLRNGLKKLTLAQNSNIAKVSCRDFISGMEDPEKQQEIHHCLINNLNYPQEAIDAQLEGRMRIRFIVDENEQIRDIQIIGSTFAILEEEAMRAAACLSGIGAATCEGKKVPTYYTLPVSFRLN